MVNIADQLSLEEFLALPEGDIYYELVNGQAIPKVSYAILKSDESFTFKKYQIYRTAILAPVVRIQNEF